MEAIAAEHLGWIQSWLLCLGVLRQDLGAVTSDVLLAVLRSLSTFDPTQPGGLRAWLFRIVERHAKRHLERASKDAGRLVDDSGDFVWIADPSPDPEELLIEERAKRLIEELIAEMEPRVQRVFKARYLTGMSIEEIAEAFSIPDHSVKNWLRAGLKQFEAGLKRRQAEQRRRGAHVLPITAATLLDHERAALLTVSDELRGEVMAQLRETLANGYAAPSQGWKPLLRTPPLAAKAPKLASLTGKIGAVAAGGGGGAGIIVSTVLHLASLDTLPSKGAWNEPNAGPAAAPVAAAPPAAAPATTRARAAARTATAARAVAPSAIRSPVADSSSEQERALLRAASSAMKRGENDRASDLLHLHGDAFSEGALKMSRQNLKPSPPSS
jgi:RNA polymerase sigma factor (sigma-70 family)